MADAGAMSVGPFGVDVPQADLDQLLMSATIFWFALLAADTTIRSLTDPSGEVADFLIALR